MNSHEPKDYSIQLQALWYTVQAANLLNSWLIIFLKIFIDFLQTEQIYYKTCNNLQMFKECYKSLPIMNMKRKKINSNYERLQLITVTRLC